MEIPGLVRTRLGDEAVESAVSLGDEDAVCFTPSRTLLYRGEGLLSDEEVTVYTHDVDRLTVTDGRRKTKFTLEYVDGTESFSVPGNRAGPVLDRLMNGVLTTAGVIDADESLSGVFRFSELTLTITEDRLVKSIGAAVFDSNHEEFPYDAVTGLSFEDGSVATSVVLEVGGRPERIKAPNDRAPQVREALESALFSYHGVTSLSELNKAVGTDDADREPTRDSDVDIGGGISPLVGEGSGSEPAGSPGASPADGGAAGAAEPDATSEDNPATGAGLTARGADSTGDARASAGGIDPEEFEALKSHVADLSQAVETQNERLAAQQETIAQLIEELRRGR